MYQLQAFPTQSVLKDFTPYRGIILSSRIEITNQDDQLILGSYLSRSNSVQIDTTPILARIAKEWNYDLELIKEGNGDTGVEEHSWTVYGHEKSTPQIIRWKLGKAQVIITIGARISNMKFIAIGNKAALPILDKLNQLFADMENNPCNNYEVTTEINNQLVKTEVKNQILENPLFSAECNLWINFDNKLSPSQYRHYNRLLNSCNIRIIPHGGTFTSIRIPSLKIQNRYDRDEEISDDLVKIIYNLGIPRCHIFATFIIGQCLIPDYGASAHIAPESMDLEDLERSRWLDVQSKFLENAPFGEEPVSTNMWNDISVGIDFSEADLAVLRGTGADVGQRKSFEDTVYNPDLLEHLVIDLLHSVPMKLVKMRQTERLESGIKITGTMKVDSKILRKLEPEFREVRNNCYTKIQPLTNPFFSVHQGMPVRVDHSVLVWRKIDKEALVSDVWYDLDSGHLHVANLYRAPIPTT